MKIMDTTIKDTENSKEYQDAIAYNEGLRAGKDTGTVFGDIDRHKAGIDFVGMRTFAPGTGKGTKENGLH